jgi:peroxiredoxin
VRCIAVGADSSQLRQFIEAFGVRLLALIDQGSTVYDQYRVPNPTAPYPQDYIIDQQGIVRYWNDAYDPQAVMRTIDRLLQTGITDSPGHYANRFDSV